MLRTLFHPATQFVVAASLVITHAFSPPRILVKPVSNPAAAPAGAVFLVEGEHHSETDLLTITGRAEGMVSGKRVTKQLTLVKASGGQYSLTKQWDAGSPWVLVLTVEQGAGGSHGVAEAIVQIDAAGKLLNIDYPAAGWEGKDYIPKRTSSATIEAALMTMVAKR